MTINTTDSCGCKIEENLFTLCETHQQELNEKLANPPLWVRKLRNN